MCLPSKAIFKNLTKLFKRDEKKIKPTKEFLSPDEIAEDIPKRLSKKDLDLFIGEGKKRSDFVNVHMEITFKRWIRNQYKLWDENNPYTFKNYEEVIIGGVDYSPKHPDNLSETIYQKFLKNIRK